MTYVVRYLLIVLYTVVWGVPACIVPLFDRSGEGVIWIGRQWLRWIFWTCGISVDAAGLENVDSRRSYVFMSNHQSVFDVGALALTLPVRWRFVAKRELTWIPLFGWAIWLGGHVIVDRGRRDKAIASLRRAAKRIRDGTSVIIFPEGTRSETGALREFKSGGFHLALEAGVPIVPVTVSGSQHLTPKRSLRVESGHMKVRYGKPIETTAYGHDEREALKLAVRDAIQAGYDPELQRPESP
ncbi:MAG TPA: lysophospholipid acyltransferase family protein [Myxococcota bacterium]|nr:lysophospholipid acyltransferase family protein [Myxococcota bacterium]